MSRYNQLLLHQREEIQHSMATSSRVGIDFVRGLKDKVVVVTGGGGGIGGATCRRFSEEGAKVAVFDVNAAASAALAQAQAIVQNGGKRSLPPKGEGLREISFAVQESAVGTSAK